MSEFYETIVSLSYMGDTRMKFAENPAKPLDIRIAAVEVLGWFTNSYRNPEIEAMCSRLMSANNEAAPEALKQEAIRTLERMK